jgi:hypothetical protein
MERSILPLEVQHGHGLDFLVGCPARTASFLHEIMVSAGESG